MTASSRMVRVMADLASLVLKVDSRDVKRGATDLDGLARAGSRAEKSTDSMGRGFRNSARDAGSLGAAAGAAAINLRTLGAAAAAAAAVAGGRGFVSMADEIAMLSARINLLSGSTSAYAAVQGDLLSIANSSQTSLSAVGQLYSRLITPITKLGGSSKEALGITQSLSAALLMSGASAQESASAILQFSQAMGKGKLNGDEFISISENAPIVLRAMEDELGRTTAELYAMAEAGQLTSGVVGNTLLAGIDKFTAGAAAMPQTVAGAMIRLKNEFAVASNEINKSGGITGGIAEIINLFTRVVPIVKDGIIGGIQQLQGFLERNKDTVSAIKDAFSITAQVVGMVGSAVFGVLGMVVKVATESGLIKGIFNVIAGAVQIAANGMTILGAAVIKAGDFVIEKLGNPLQDIIQLLEKAARAVGLNGIADALAGADKAFDKSRSSAVAWADSVSAKVRAGNFNVLGFSLATDKAAESVKKATPEFAKLGEGAATAGKVGAAELKKMQKAADDAAAAIERTLQAQERESRALMFGEPAAARADFINTGASSDDLARYDANEKLNQSLRDQKKLYEDSQAAQKAAAESATAAFDSYMSASFGADLASGFDQASAALGRFVQGIETLGAIEAGNAAARKGAEAEYLAGKIDQETLTKKLAKLESKNASDQIGAFADITGAAKGMFKDQSAGAKALGKIEQTLRVAQLAHSAWEKKDEAVKLAVKLKGYAIDLGTFIASVPLKIAGFLGIGGAAGAAATAAAAIQPGPAAFVGFAAMAALIASIGLGGRGGGGGATAFNPQISTAGGTGSVLGDPQAQSETLKKSIDKLGDIASIELRFTSQTLNVLRQIEENTGGFDTSLAKLNVAIGAQVRNIGIPSGFTAADVSSAPEKFSKQFFAALVGEKNNFSNTQGAAVGNLFTSQVVLPTIAGFKEVAALVGASANQIDAALSGTVIGGGRFGGEDAGRNLNQLSAEDRANLIAATASTLLDQLFGTLVGVAPSLSYFKDFQRAGEGIGETLIRVKSSIELADNMLGRLGVTALDVSVITRKQGDLTTEIIRESVLLQDATKNIIGGFAEIVGSFDGTGEEITDLVLQLREMQDAIRATGKSGEYLTTFMIAGAGGADRLSDGLSAFFDFLSPAEQAAELTRRVSAEFTRIGQIVPQSVQGFRELIAGIDISTESGQKLYGQVIALAPAFTDLQDALESVGNEAQDAKDAITKAFKDLSDAIKTAESDLQAAFNRESTALKELIRNHDDAAKRLREFSRTLVGALDTPEQSLTRLRAEFDAIARAARLGDSGAVARLPEVGGALKDAVIANAATAQDAAREIARIRAESDAAATVQERQKTIAEQQLDALTLSVDNLIQVGDNILTVRDAVDNLKSLQTFENKAIADATAAGFGALFQQNGQTLSAIEKGTQASASINASIQGLLDITARQEAARIASEQAQQAAIEQAKRDAAERTRLETVAKLNADLGASVATVGQTKATIDDALTRIKTLGGDRIANAVSNSAANATFGRGALGESISDAAFLDVTGGSNQASRESAANAAANAAFYGNLSTLDVVRGGLNEQLVSAYSRSDALRQQIISLGGIPAFATGGMHSGGLRLVGENGPELEYTGPSRIFNAGQTSSMLDNSDQINEMRLLRDEMKSYLWSISKSTLRTADRLDRWDDGDRMNVRIDNEADDPALVRTVA